jgi:hypothetical protein
MLKTYCGGCHCGAIRYEADLDLSKGTAKCNCTFCFKARLWTVIIKPGAFRLLAGQALVSDYYKPGGAVHHYFCSSCGIRSFERGHLGVLGGDFVTVNVSCLEEIDSEELLSVPIFYKNGRDNQWFLPPAQTWHL